MTTQTLWWCILAGSLGSLWYNVAVYWRHRRRRAPLPTYAAGSVSGGLSFLLLIVSNLLDLQGVVTRIALAGSVVLLGVSIALAIIAQRRAKRVSR